MKQDKEKQSSAGLHSTCPKSNSQATAILEKGDVGEVLPSILLHYTNNKLDENVTQNPGFPNQSQP